MDMPKVASSNEKIHRLNYIVLSFYYLIGLQVV